MKTQIIALFIQLSILGICLVGEVKCFIKAVDCNWQPIGKAEIIYTASAFTGFGIIVGYMDIQDK
jgi:hypothetical protein